MYTLYHGLYNTVPCKQIGLLTILASNILYS
ncbi:hypothetical protein KUCAC02_028485 [Chaenocephalus aceratus]|uniref:Uncharacterized protein n=1 Tax=Chaenocephalus aceratus TaxID=36190 RepID=A0ACB9X349_CHAAC|nr:hypothetical protein KUCAC02_028485 [Chaenocephalus aceratus]